MKLFSLLAAALLGSTLTAPAFAQQSTIDPSHISNRLGRLTPYTGAYIAWDVQGVSFEYDNSPSSGNGFITLHTYDPNGVQINYVGQQKFVPTSEAERLATGLIGRAAGSFFKASGGTCLGCAPKQQTLTDVGIAYSVVWTTPRRAILTLSGAVSGTYTLVAANFDQQDDDQFLSGTWALTAYADYGATHPGDPSYNYQVAGMAVVSIAPLSTSYHFGLAMDAVAGTFLPPSTARLYSLSCLADEKRQGGSDQSACNGAFLNLGATNGASAVFWFDPVTKAAGVESARIKGFVVELGNAFASGTPFAQHCDLSIEPDVLRGHCVGRIPTLSAAGAGIAMMRIPDGTVRSSYDYSKTP